MSTKNVGVIRGRGKSNAFQVSLEALEAAERVARQARFDSNLAVKLGLQAERASWQCLDTAISCYCLWMCRYTLKEASRELGILQSEFRSALKVIGVRRYHYAARRAEYDLLCTLQEAIEDGESLQEIAKLAKMPFNWLIARLQILGFHPDAEQVRQAKIEQISPVGLENAMDLVELGFADFVASEFAGVRRADLVCYRELAGTMRGSFGRGHLKLADAISRREKIALLNRTKKAARELAEAGLLTFEFETLPPGRAALLKDFKQRWTVDSDKFRRVPRQAELEERFFGRGMSLHEIATEFEAPANEMRHLMQNYGLNTGRMATLRRQLIYLSLEGTRLPSSGSAYAYNFRELLDEAWALAVKGMLSVQFFLAPRLRKVLTNAAKSKAV